MSLYMVYSIRLARITTIYGVNPQLIALVRKSPMVGGTPRSNIETQQLLAPYQPAIDSSQFAPCPLA